jgi:deoxyribodipyrimidine photo-lyase
MTTLSNSISSSGSVHRVRQRIVIHWFRHGDLRLHDNSALTHSSVLAKGDEEKRRCKVLPIFCFDKRIFGNNSLTPSGSLKCGPRRAKFIIESVIDLRQRLQEHLHSQLLVGYGEPAEIFDKLLGQLHDRSEIDGDDNFELDANIVCQEEPAKEERAGVREVSAILTKYNVDRVIKRVQRIWGSTLYMPHKMPFKKNFADVSNRCQGFTNRMVHLHKIAELHPIPKYLPFLDRLQSEMLTYMPTLEDLGYTDEQILLANTTDRRSKSALFRGGETAGLARVQEYIWDTDMLKDFSRMRNRPITENHSTMFSAWLAHGCLSPRFVASEAMRNVRERYTQHGNVIAQQDLVKRDFCKYYAVKHSNRTFRRIGPVPQRYGSDRYIKRSRSIKNFNAWKEGRTGYPLVDASMRELAATGYISDRCRLIASSFLCNDLHHQWTVGADWFESNLIDYNVFCNWVVSAEFEQKNLKSPQFFT